MSTLARREILVVDDDAAVRNSIGLVLKMAGYEVSLAENGFDALLQLRRAFPAVIISDLNMPQKYAANVRVRIPVGGSAPLPWDTGDCHERSVSLWRCGAGRSH